MSKKNNALKQRQRIRKPRARKSQREALSEFDHAWDQFRSALGGKKNRVSPMDDAELAEMTERIFLEQMVLNCSFSMRIKRRAHTAADPEHRTIDNAQKEYGYGPISLEREGDFAVVRIEHKRQWVEVIRVHLESNFGSTIYPAGIQEVIEGMWEGLK
jgi:hypothetical protein